MNKKEVFNRCYHLYKGKIIKCDICRKPIRKYVLLENRKNRDEDFFICERCFFEGGENI